MILINFSPRNNDQRRLRQSRPITLADAKPPDKTVRGHATFVERTVRLCAYSLQRIAFAIAYGARVFISFVSISRLRRE